MFLVPIGRDNAVIQRHAWVTYSILAVSLVFFLAISIGYRGHDRETFENGRAMELILSRFPWLHVPDELAEVIGAKALKELRDSQPRPPIRYDEREATAAQKRLNDVVHEFVEHQPQQPIKFFGYTPGESSRWTLLVAMFANVSLLVLICDGLSLFSTAPYVEDVYGRPLFLLLYISGGLVGGLTFAAIAVPNETIPFIGATAAISSVAGAFFLRFFNSRIEMFFVPMIWRPMYRFRFFVPTWVVIPFFLLLQAAAISKGDRNYSYAAVSGFAWGLAFAAVMKVAKIEERFIAPRINAKTSWSLDENLLFALDAQAVGDLTGLQAAMTAYAAKEATDADGLRQAIALSIQHGLPETDTLLARLLGVVIASDGDAAAASLIRQHLAQTELTRPRFMAKAAAFADRTDRRDLALLLYQRLCEVDPASPITVRHLLRIGALHKLRGEVEPARAALDRARSHPACSGEVRATIEARLGQLSV
ncbi:MAG: rhomboid family protein [Acidobacteria bacterium]|nr:rhomboid family protein [Acidobacteriota bacterium]